MTIRCLLRGCQEVKALLTFMIKLFKFTKEFFSTLLNDFMNRVTEEHYFGCILGGAIGDALGAPIEFMSINSIRNLHGENGITDYVEFQDGSGEITDDTQMLLFTAEALIEANRKSIEDDQILDLGYKAYLRWLSTQEFDSYEKNISGNDSWLMQQKGLYKRRAPGNTCLSSLMSGKCGTPVNPLNNSKGCGTIMRIAPVGLAFPSNPGYAFEQGIALSAITHGHPSGYLSGGFMAALISDLSDHMPLEESINEAVNLLKSYEDHIETLEAVMAALDLYDSTKNDRQKVTPETLEQLGAGWVAEEALAMSLYSSMIFHDNFEKGVLFAVNHSGDSDSTGAITGNILGLINGIDSIPQKWIEKLNLSDIILKIAEELYSVQRISNIS
jgi:ADP-ribosylglycohydrolase